MFMYFVILGGLIGLCGGIIFLGEYHKDDIDKDRSIY